MPERKSKQRSSVTLSISALTFVVGISIPFARRVIPLAGRAVVLLPVGLNPPVLPPVWCPITQSRDRQFP